MVVDYKSLAHSVEDQWKIRMTIVLLRIGSKLMALVYNMLCSSRIVTSLSTIVNITQLSNYTTRGRTRAVNKSRHKHQPLPEGVMNSVNSPHELCYVIIIGVYA